MVTRTLTAIVHKEGNLYVADCPEIGTVSQGRTVEEAVENLKEATMLYLETFGEPENSPRRSEPRMLVTTFEMACA